MKRRGLVQFLVVAALLVAFVVGCSVLLRTGGDGGGGGAGADEPEEQTTMTFNEFQSVQLESTREQIEERFGESVPRQTVIEAGVIPDDPTSAGCIYYRADPPTFGEWFEFCFEGGRLTNKSTL